MPHCSAQAKPHGGRGGGELPNASPPAFGQVLPSLEAACRKVRMLFVFTVLSAEVWWQPRGLPFTVPASRHLSGIG